MNEPQPRRISVSNLLIPAILDGRKTMTRRLLRSQPADCVTSAGSYSNSRDGLTGKWSWLSGDPEDIDTWEFQGDFTFKPVPGDTVVVAETHYAFGHWDQVQKKGRMGWQFVCDRPDDIRFEPVKAALPSMDKADPAISTWYKRNARFMRASDARISLRITDVRMERLQDITEEDAIAEGVYYNKELDRYGTNFANIAWHPKLAFPSARAWFQNLWEALHDIGSWEDNLWCAVVQFERIKP